MRLGVIVEWWDIEKGTDEDKGEEKVEGKDDGEERGNKDVWCERRRDAVSLLSFCIPSKNKQKLQCSKELKSCGPRDN